MKEHITSNKIQYTLHGDYYLPDLKMPEQDNRPIGIWGHRHKNYLLHHHKIRYIYHKYHISKDSAREYILQINPSSESFSDYYNKPFDKSYLCHAQTLPPELLLLLCRMGGC